MSARIIALLGAECTGKSTLAEALAREFGAALVSEYLREWCDREGRTPQRHEQAAIAAEQSARIRAAAGTSCLVICDTTPLITALCSEHYFDDRTLTAQALGFQRGCDLTLLCAPDLPWEADGFLRDGPGVREQFDARLRATLARAGLDSIDVRGAWPERLGRARDAVASLLVKR